MMAIQTAFFRSVTPMLVHTTTQEIYCILTAIFCADKVLYIHNLYITHITGISLFIVFYTEISMKLFTCILCLFCLSQHYITGTLYRQAAYLCICFIFAESNGLNTLSELQKFITGCKGVPPLRLPKRITVKFKHGCMERCRCRPTASTCDLSVTLQSSLS